MRFAVIFHCHWDCVVCHSRGIVLLPARKTPCFVRFLQVINSWLLLSRVPSLAIVMRKSWDDALVTIAGGGVHLEPFQPPCVQGVGLPLGVGEVAIEAG